MEDDKRISELTDQLDSIVARDGALVRVDKIYKPGTHVCTGNKSGLQRLGIELLRASVTLQDRANSSPDEDYWEPLEYLHAHPLNNLGIVRRCDGIQKETTQKTTAKRSTSQTVFGLLAQVVWLASAALLIVGGITVFRWLVDLLT